MEVRISPDVKYKAINSVVDAGFRNKIVRWMIEELLTKGEITETNREIAERFGTAINYIQILVRKLRERGIVQTEYIVTPKGQSKRVIRLHLEFLKRITNGG